MQSKSKNCNKKKKKKRKNDFKEKGRRRIVKTLYKKIYINY